MLEKHVKNIQDFEFMVHAKALFISQTRNGKRTGTAASKTASDFADGGIQSPNQFSKVFHLKRSMEFVYSFSVQRGTNDWPAALVGVDDAVSDSEPLTVVTSATLDADRSIENNGTQIVAWLIQVRDKSFWIHLTHHQQSQALDTVRVLIRLLQNSAQDGTNLF